MGTMFSTVLHLLLAALGAVALPSDGMLGVAAAVLAVALIAIVIALVSPRWGIRRAAHPRRAIDVSVLLAQSDPDAAGHPRPRAPGFAPAA